MTKKNGKKPAVDDVRRDGNSKHAATVGNVVVADTRDIPVDRIIVGSGRRSIRPDVVAILVESFTRSGQLVPIIVTVERRNNGEWFRLHAGGHRLVVARQLNWPTINATIIVADETHCALVEIDENLARGELTALERAEATATRKKLYEVLFPQAKHGGAPGKPGGGKTAKDAKVASFVADTANLSGRSVRSIARDAQIGEHLEEKAKELIRNTEVANNQIELLKLARMEPGEQVRLATAVADGKARDIRDAIVQRKKAKIAAQVRSRPERPMIYRADALDFLHAQEPQSFDLLLTDPVYASDDGNYLEFAKLWIPLALQRLKRSARAFIFTGVDPDELIDFGSLLRAVRGDFTIGNVLPWTHRNRVGPEKKKDFRDNWQACFYLRGPDAPDWDDPLLTDLFAVQDIPAPDERQGDYYHTWQKPDPLAERLVGLSTKEGGRVLDCFAGTGAHLIAATKLGRVGIGCDNSDEMLAIARKRGCTISAFEPVAKDLGATDQDTESAS